MVETLAQDWSSMDREVQYECAGGHPRSYAQLGWTCGKDGLHRNLCEGSEMSRPSMVEMETSQLERSGERQVVWPTPTAVQNLQVGRHGCWGGLQICWKRGWSVENCPRQHGLVALCSKPWKLEAIFEMWKEPCIDGPGCLGDPSASGMTVASMALMASMASMVASMALLVALLDSRVSVVAPLDRLKLMVEPKSGAERVDRLSHKICEERADGLTHKICEERADGSIWKWMAYEFRG